MCRPEYEMTYSNAEYHKLYLSLSNDSRLACLVVWPVQRGNGLICHVQRQPYNPRGEWLILSSCFYTNNYNVVEKKPKVTGCVYNRAVLSYTVWLVKCDMLCSAVAMLSTFNGSMYFISSVSSELLYWNWSYSVLWLMTASSEANLEGFGKNQSIPDHDKNTKHEPRI